MDDDANFWDRGQDWTTRDESTFRNAEFWGLCEIQVESVLFKQNLEVYTTVQTDNFKFPFYAFLKNDPKLWAPCFN